MKNFFSRQIFLLLPVSEKIFALEQILKKIHSFTYHLITDEVINNQSEALQLGFIIADHGFCVPGFHKLKHFKYGQY